MCDEVNQWIAVFSTIYRLCSASGANVKRIIGVSYEQLDGEKEPDLNQLTLVYRDQSVRKIYNITSAATKIVNSPEFHPRQKLILFIHGFTDDPTKNSFSNISDAFLMQGECNVLALDGSSLIHWLYLRSTTYVRFMGEKLGEVLASMVRKGLDPAAIHIIGHSLGSHISGFAGKTFQNLTGKRIGRISGLDPAGPCFSEVEPDLRLKSTDADFVDVMHTDAGVYGLKEDVGHVDFYPNGGSQQPDCFFQTCSHSRAWLLYSESVMDPHAFPAVKCDDGWDGFKKGECNYKDINYMGYHAKPSIKGAYYLQTGGEDAHFGLHQRGLKFNNTQGVIQNLGDKAKDLGEKTQSLFG